MNVILFSSRKGLGNRMESLKDKEKEIKSRLTKDSLMKRRLSEWIPILASEVCVYRMGSQYIAKRFNSISYVMCSKKEAEEIAKENIDALLKLKYFPNTTDDEYDRIKDIKSCFMDEISTSLIDVKLSGDSDVTAMEMNRLPDSSMAFTNGVFDFRENRWLITYDKFRRESTLNGVMQVKEVITYDPTWYVAWNFNRDFTPKKIIDDGNGISVVDDDLSDKDSVSPMTLDFESYVSLLKELDKTKKNKFFELFYNMAHDENDRFSMSKAKHLAEILGFFVLRSFSEHFVFFIGEGGNGKDTLFDSYFKGRIDPMITTNSMEDIENNQFIVGSIAKAPMNIRSESEQGTVKKSEAIKQLTGSEIQTIEEKGVDRYTGYINCKFGFSANNKEQVKFKDDSPGFRRRMNMYEVFFQYDPDRNFMKRGDYYDTSYVSKSEFRERESDSMWSFYYMCMQGIKLGTGNFTKLFDFRDEKGNKLNDYSSSYVDVDEKISSCMKNLSFSSLCMYQKMYKENDLILSEGGKTLSADKDFTYFYGKTNGKGEAIQSMLEDKGSDDCNGSYYRDNHMVFIKLASIPKMISLDVPSATFTANVKKIYRNSVIRRLSHNIAYVLCDLSQREFRIVDVKSVKDRFTIDGEV